MGDAEIVNGEWFMGNRWQSIVPNSDFLILDNRS